MDERRARPGRGADGRAARAIGSPLLVIASLGLLASVAVVACGEGDMAGDEGLGGGSAGSAGAPSPTSTASAGSGGAPPEEELESSFTAPVATGHFVWIANPSSGRVAYVDARTLVVRVVDAGDAPTHLAAVPDADADVALVLNVASRDATLLRADPESGALAARTYEVPAGGNAWSVAPDGRWAIAWTDAARVDEADPIDGYQDVQVLDLASEDARSIALTVGYRPVAVSFDAEARRAFAVSQDGITVIDLEGDAPRVIENVPLADDPLAPTTTRDVAITPDGALALVRREGASTIDVHRLEGDEAPTTVALAGAATDLDLAPDGSIAVAVVREAGEVALLPIPGVADEPEDVATFVVEDTVIGSTALAAETSVGVLYTNAVPSAALTVFDWSAEEPAPRSLLLRAPVAAVFPTPDAAHAVVLHDALEVEGTRYAGALSVVPIAEPLPPKIVGLDAPPIAVAVHPDGTRALIAVGDGATGEHGLVVAHMPSLRVDVHALGSLPIAAGIVAGADRGFVAQEHPDGRLTFVDFATGEVRTLTGFELAAQVVDGGAP